MEGQWVTASTVDALYSLPWINIFYILSALERRTVLWTAAKSSYIIVLHISTLKTKAADAFAMLKGLLYDG